MQSLKSPADIEAAYRFSRNQSIKANAIAEAGFAATAEQAKDYDCLLALENTTSLEFKHHTVRDEMGHTTSHRNSKGMQAHSVLLLAPGPQHIVGLIEYLTYKTTHQQRFIVRSMQSRCIEESSDKLYQYSESLKQAGKRIVQVR